MHGPARLQRIPKRLAGALAIAGTLAAGVIGGFAARLVHLPLPWLLGSLFTIMALSLARAPVRLIAWGRPAGTAVVGASTGLQFTATVVAKLVTLLPLIIAGAFLSTIVGAIGGLLYMRLTGVDRVSAFFATVPGGVVETLNVAPRYGGQLEPIMVAQTTRVALIVVFAPFLVISLAGGSAQNPLLAVPVAPWLPVLAVLGVSCLVAALLSRTRSPNAWLMAPLFIAAAVGHLGWIEGRMPDLLIIAAQVVIGCALGAQFRPEFLTRLFRLFVGVVRGRVVRGRRHGAVRRNDCVADGISGADDGARHGTRRHRRDGAHRQGARARFDDDRRLPADAHHHRADLVPHRAHPVQTGGGLGLRQAGGFLTPTTTILIVCARRRPTSK